MARRSQQDKASAQKAKDWSRSVDRTDDRINRLNQSGKSAKEKLEELLNDRT